MAGDVAWVGSGILLGLGSIAVLLALYLMLAGRSLNGSGDEGWWTQGQGQQFVASAVGWLLLAGAVLLVRRRRYLAAAILIVPAALLFGLWGLLVDAGWSDRGPLALGYL